MKKTQTLNQTNKTYRVHSVIRDSFQEYADEISLVLFSPGCNYRCPTCSNKILLDRREYNNPENLSIKEALEKYVTPLTTAVVFLGGEPTIYGDSLVKASLYIREKYPDLKIKVFTNGYSPYTIKKMIEWNALDALSIDLKALSDFPRYLGAPVPEDIYLSNIYTVISLCTEHNISYEIRTTTFEGLDIPMIKEYVKEHYPSAKHILQEPLKNYQQ